MDKWEKKKKKKQGKKLSRYLTSSSPQQPGHCERNKESSHSNPDTIEKTVRLIADI